MAPDQMHLSSVVIVLGDVLAQPDAFFSVARLAQW